MRERVYRRVPVSVEQRETGNLKRETLLAWHFEVADLAAEQAIILAVGAEADSVPALAKNAEVFALALLLFPVALRAEEGHAPRVTLFAARLK
jgi:hypothetical protein